MTGAKVWITAKMNRRDDDTDALIELNSVDDPIQVRILDAANGIIRIRIYPANTESLAQSYYPYDIQVKESDDTVTTIQSGYVEITLDSTISRV